jgi:hypothetical protein
MCRCVAGVHASWKLPFLIILIVCLEVWCCSTAYCVTWCIVQLLRTATHGCQLCTTTSMIGICLINVAQGRQLVLNKQNMTTTIMDHSTWLVGALSYWPCTVCRPQHFWVSYFVISRERTQIAGKAVCSILSKSCCRPVMSCHVKLATFAMTLMPIQVVRLQQRLIISHNRTPASD